MKRQKNRYFTLRFVLPRSWVGYPSLRQKGCGMQSPSGPKVYPKVMNTFVFCIDDTERLTIQNLRFSINICLECLGKTGSSSTCPLYFPRPRWSSCLMGAIDDWFNRVGGRNRVCVFRRGGVVCVCVCVCVSVSVSVCLCLMGAIDEWFNRVGERNRVCVYRSPKIWLVPPPTPPPPPPPPPHPAETPIHP